MTSIRIAFAAALAIAALFAGARVNRASTAQAAHVTRVVALAQPNIGGCCEDPD